MLAKSVLFSLSLLILLALGCESVAPPSPTRFEALSAAHSGISFANQLTDGVQFNILNYPYFYNGGGVAVGDLNGDSLPDLFFTGNQVPNRLYLNRGALRFEDITEQAGVAGEGDWATGVSLADVNADGRLDIYVNYVSGLLDRQGHNELFINQGDGTFREEAQAWGLAFAGYGTQGAFFDYDGDGDLDLYQLNHSIRPAETIGPATQRQTPNSLAGDRLMRNEGDHFTDVTAQAGISSSRLGYGLSLLVGDLDRDGLPDVYVCNDFHEDDYLYLNQGDGTFREALREWIGHSSRFSMGSDLTDLNQDARPDLITLDMKPEVETIRKTAQSPESYDQFRYKLSFGYYHQYPHNALQLHRGNRFAEVAQLAGIDATDWSWSALWADYDNDRRPDLFITNGIYRRPDDMDYINFISDPAVKRQLNRAPSAADLAFIAEMPQVPQPNYLYRNLGDLQFEEVAAAWGLGQPGFSNGATYADLDRDGDLDLVVNHLNATAQVFRNHSRERDSSHFLGLRLAGAHANPFGYGAEVFAYVQGELLWQQHQPVRGFQSCVEPGHLHLGLGSAQRVDSLRIVWPDGKQQRLTNLSADQTITLRQAEAREVDLTLPSAKPTPLFLLRHELTLGEPHQENDFIDFNREPLIPHRLSTQGPRVAVGDIDGDGQEDLYLPGAAGQAGQLLVQQADGHFRAQQGDFWARYAAAEEVQALFFDADGDEDLDLYLAYGGHQFNAEDVKLSDRIFLNEGGRFVDGSDRLPLRRVNTGCVAAADYDGDGDQDLLVGGRSVSGSYGLTPPSALLVNDGRGHFTDQTERLAPALRTAGMLTDACWLDLDQDGQRDLVLVGEWMPPRVFRQRDGHLALDSAAVSPRSEGWWNRLLPVDVDGDGDLDLVAGNLGLNSTLRATAQEPCHLYVADFDQNGDTDPILCFTEQGTVSPWATRDEMLKQVISLRRRYPDYQSYAHATVSDLFGQEALDGALQKSVQTFAHAWFENQSGQLIRHDLPRLAQLAPIYSLLADDVNQDGHPDLLLAGNFYGVGPNRGRYDAGEGLLLLGDGQGHWQVKSAYETGFAPQGEVRDLRWLTVAGERLLLVSRNDASMQVFARKP
jgi:enediyne biosynthesis protein E4